MKYRITHGIPGDEQQSAHLLDADLCITADHRFGLLSQAVAAAAPVPIAAIAEIERSAPSAVEQLEVVMRQGRL